MQREIDSGSGGESWEDHFKQCMERGEKRFDGPFFIVVLTKKERLLDNVVRRYFIDRLTCPLPEYDQTVFRVIPGSDAIEYIWSVPDWQCCEDLKAHRHELSKELWALYEMVCKFEDGSLLKEAEILNEDAEKAHW